MGDAEQRWWSERLMDRGDRTRTKGSGAESTQVLA